MLAALLYSVTLTARYFTNAAFMTPNSPSQFDNPSMRPWPSTGSVVACIIGPLPVGFAASACSRS